MHHTPISQVSFFYTATKIPLNICRTETDNLSHYSSLVATRHLLHKINLTHHVVPQPFLHGKWKVVRAAWFAARHLACNPVLTPGCMTIPKIKCRQGRREAGTRIALLRNNLEYEDNRNEIQVCLKSENRMETDRHACLLGVVLVTR